MSAKTEGVKKGDKVKVHYKGSFDDGTVFDSSEGREPLEFTVGEGQVIRGFDDALIGMKKGENKKISIPAKDAYGNYHEELLRKVPRDVLPKDREPQVGMILGLQREDGMQTEARITEVSQTEVTLDLNHPLAGKALHFLLTLIAIN